MKTEINLIMIERVISSSYSCELDIVVAIFVLDFNRFDLILHDIARVPGMLPVEFKIEDIKEVNHALENLHCLLEKNLILNWFQIN